MLRILPASRRCNDEGSICSHACIAFLRFEVFFFIVKRRPRDLTILPLRLIISAMDLGPTYSILAKWLKVPVGASIIGVVAFACLWILNFGRPEHITIP